MPMHEWNGEQRRFEIKRDSLAHFESVARDSAYALLRRFADGEWRVADVEIVLAYALHGAPKFAIAQARMARELGMPIASMPYAIPADIRRTIERDGAGEWAGLCADILTAALFKPEASDGE